jgi:hypothetical protein
MSVYFHPPPAWPQNTLPFCVGICFLKSFNVLLLLRGGHIRHSTKFFFCGLLFTVHALEFFSSKYLRHRRKKVSAYALRAQICSSRAVIGYSSSQHSKNYYVPDRTHLPYPEPSLSLFRAFQENRRHRTFCFSRLLTILHVSSFMYYLEIV